MKTINLIIITLLIYSCGTLSNKPQVKLEFSGHKESIEILFVQDGKSQFVGEINIGRPNFELRELGNDEFSTFELENETEEVITGYELKHIEANFGQKPLNEKTRYYVITFKKKNSSYIIYEFEVDELGSHGKLIKVIHDNSKSK